MKQKAQSIECIQCGAKSKKSCPDCGRPLCGRCGTKKLIIGIGNKPVIQNRLCRDCVQKRAVNTTFGVGYIVYKLLQKFDEHVKSKTRKSSSW